MNITQISTTKELADLLRNRARSSLIEFMTRNPVKIGESHSVYTVANNSQAIIFLPHFAINVIGTCENPALDIDGSNLNVSFTNTAQTLETHKLMQALNILRSVVSSIGEAMKTAHVAFTMESFADSVQKIDRVISENFAVKLPSQDEADNLMFVLARFGIKAICTAKQGDDFTCLFQIENPAHQDLMTNLILNARTMNHAQHLNAMRGQV